MENDELLNRAWKNRVINGKPKSPPAGVLYGLSVATTDIALINAI